MVVSWYWNWNVANPVGVEAQYPSEPAARESTAAVQLEATHSPAKQVSPSGHFIFNFSVVSLEHPDWSVPGFSQV